LAWWELLPLASFVILRGLCRSCGRPIGCRTFLMEAAGLGLGLILALRLGPAWSTGLAVVVGCAWLALAVIDLETGLLPDAITLPLLAAGLLWSAALGPGWKIAGLGALFCGGLLYLVGLAYRLLTGRVGLGGGDPKLAAGLGAWLGPETGLVALVWGAGLGAVFGLGLMATGKAGLKTALPFGPFLALAGLAWLVLRPPFH
jgi:leader peptidase (prepilin peptidase)/N-methyltransferase